MTSNALGTTTRHLLPASLFAVAFAALVHVAGLVWHSTIRLVEAEQLLPLWDLATHLGHGWTDYHYLRTLQLHLLAWDLWLQGYWPPAHSLFQVPFYLVLGGGMSAGLQSSLAAFILIGLTGTGLLYTQWGRAALLPAAVLLTFLVTSPFFLAYASVAMTEVPGALAQTCVLLSYLRYHQRRSVPTARVFAVSLTVLFFTKYNYFLMLAVPLLLHEYLERTTGWSHSRRLEAPWRWARGWLISIPGVILVAWAVGVLVVTLTGGFKFQVLGQQISVGTIGNTGHVVLYLGLGRLLYLHKRGRIDWSRLFALDPLIRPLLVWFGLPLVLWFASPYPNHIKDFVNLVINRPMGEASVAAGLATYSDALREDYFATPWLTLLAFAAFGVAAARYRRQPLLMRWLILIVPLQLAMVAAHQTRFERFLLVTLMPLWLAAAGEIGYWFRRLDRRGLVAGLAAPLVLGYGLLASHEVVAGAAFRKAAFENYTRSPALAAALASIREGLAPGDRLAIQGRSNQLSPALFRWNLGPPSGLSVFPIEVKGDLGVLDGATRILLIAPTHLERASSEITAGFPRHVAALQGRVVRGDFAFERELSVPDLHVALRMYRRIRPVQQGSTGEPRARVSAATNFCPNPGKTLAPSHSCGRASG